jgi:hypothetical protein
MSTNEIFDILKEESDPIKVIDSVLHSGVVTIGNDNDFVNMAFRVAPNLTTEELNDLQEQLRIEGVQEGESLNYKLSSELEECVLKIKVGNLYLMFNKV